VFDIPVGTIMVSTSIVLLLVVWVVLAISLNIRDARRRKRLQRARQRDKANKTVPVEQVIRLAEWKMERWMTEREKQE
jgi:predicted Holliday junction resolvase-like endonuclease